MRPGFWFAAGGARRDWPISGRLADKAREPMEACPECLAPGAWRGGKACRIWSAFYAKASPEGLRRAPQRRLDGARTTRRMPGSSKPPRQFSRRSPRAGIRLRSPCAPTSVVFNTERSRVSGLPWPRPCAGSNRLVRASRRSPRLAVKAVIARPCPKDPARLRDASS